MQSSLKCVCATKCHSCSRSHYLRSLLQSCRLRLSMACTINCIAAVHLSCRREKNASLPGNDDDDPMKWWQTLPPPKTAKKDGRWFDCVRMKLQMSHLNDVVLRERLARKWTSGELNKPFEKMVCKQNAAPTVRDSWKSIGKPPSSPRLLVLFIFCNSLWENEVSSMNQELWEKVHTLFDVTQVRKSDTEHATKL